MAFWMEEYSLFHNNFTQKNETSQSGSAKTYIVGKNKPSVSHLGVPGRAQSLFAVLWSRKHGLETLNIVQS